jgi:hypothetical protein
VGSQAEAEKQGVHVRQLVKFFPTGNWEETVVKVRCDAEVVWLAKAERRGVGYGICL